MNHDFTGQLAIVTGAGSGIGKSITKKLVLSGARVVAVDKDRDALARLQESYNAQIIPFSTDISDEAAVARIIKEINSNYDRIDILVNSAGITGATNVKSHEVVLNDLTHVLNVNFIGSFLMCKYVLPEMLRRNYGRILNIASIAGKEGNAGMLAYSASKAAVIAMTKVQGKEYAETGITINAVAPAVIRTALVDALPEEQVKYMTDKIPMKRCGTLEELTELVAYIISPLNSFTTGFTFDLSGGRATY